MTRAPAPAAHCEPQDSLHVWRHPRAIGVEGRCIGRTDVAVDPRKAKRLARRIQRAARAGRLPRIVVTSPLQRCAEVGRWLRRWGWQHHIDPTLIELDFGSWEGRSWSAIDGVEIDAWCADFVRHKPGGGEALEQLLARVSAWQARGARVVVAHAGWMQARLWLGRWPEERPTAQHWPQAPDHGRRAPVRVFVPESKSL